MSKINLNSVDVTRLHTLRSYSEKFGISYHTVYAKYNTSASGRARKPFTLVNISGNDHIYVTVEEEKELLKKKGGK